MVDIAGLNKVEVLKALWKNAQPAVFFRTSGVAIPTWDEEEAKKAVGDGCIDYFLGRGIKCNLTGDVFNAAAYDGDAKICADEVIDRLRAGTEIRDVGKGKGLCYFCKYCEATVDCRGHVACDDCGKMMNSV